MLDRIREARRNEDGFTLIELLIVIVILGVLAGIVVFAVSAFNNDGKASACKADKKNVEIAAEAYFAKKGTGASDIDDGTHSATTLVGAGYLKEAPSSTNGYTISLAGGSSTSAGTVTATGACT